MSLRPCAFAAIALVASAAVAAASACRPKLKAISPPPTAPPADLAKLVKLERIARSKDRPVFLAAAPGDTSGRLFVVEQKGTIRILRNGALEETPFLDISDRTTPINDPDSEQGLLGLAFHPRYAENGRFFVNYTDRDGETRIVEFRVSKESHDRADPASANELMKIDQPYSNHNGGHLLFGPDGKLWIGTGDGGSRNDPHRNGQNPNALLGKMLRLDVDVAADDKGPRKPEIVAVGLRNPWRYDFDPVKGDLFIADVGQKLWEEVHVVSAGDTTGHNFGWNVLEGLHCFQANTCDRDGMTDPAIEYSHDEGCSITGGIVYRGIAVPELHGVYFYADYCSAILRGFRWKDGAVVDHWDWKAALDPDFKLATISSFGRDHEGEMYVLSLDGQIWKLVRRQ